MSVLRPVESPLATVCVSGSTVRPSPSTLLSSVVWSAPLHSGIVHPLRPHLGRSLAFPPSLSVSGRRCLHLRLHSNRHHLFGRLCRFIAPLFRPLPSRRLCRPYLAPVHPARPIPVILLRSLFGRWLPSACPSSLVCLCLCSAMVLLRSQFQYFVFGCPCLVRQVVSWLRCQFFLAVNVWSASTSPSLSRLALLC